MKRPARMQMYKSANDPGPEMIPKIGRLMFLDEMIDPQIGPQMIRDRKWLPPQRLNNGMDSRI